MVKGKQKQTLRIFLKRKLPSLVGYTSDVKGIQSIHLLPIIHMRRCSGNFGTNFSRLVNLKLIDILVRKWVLLWVLWNNANWGVTNSKKSSVFKNSAQTFCCQRFPRKVAWWSWTSWAKSYEACILRMKETTVASSRTASHPSKGKEFRWRARWSLWKIYADNFKVCGYRRSSARQQPWQADAW